MFNPIVDAFIFLILMSIAAILISEGAEILEKVFGIGFVGAVILGFITTAPELVFVIVAASRVETYEVAVGSA
ncbi:MAG: sodium:calcium antiporter, partial [Promethearchaeota archaeon]